MVVANGGNPEELGEAIKKLADELGFTIVSYSFEPSQEHGWQPTLTYQFRKKEGRING